MRYLFVSSVPKIIVMFFKNLFIKQTHTISSDFFLVYQLVAHWQVEIDHAANLVFA